MNTYIKLGVTPQGHLYQSSLRVPSSGILPRRENTKPTPGTVNVYSQMLFSPYVTAAVKCSLTRPQICAIFIPRTRKLLTLLGFFAVLIPVVWIAIAIAENMIGTPPLNPDEHFTAVVVAFFVIFFLIFSPAMFWLALFFRRGTPFPAAQRRIAERYPDIPIYRDYDTFIKETKDL